MFWPCGPSHRHGRPIQLDLPRPRLCARPARTGRSARRGTLGRNLPGRMASSATRRRRRSLPAFEQLRSVPGRRDEAIMREVFSAGTNYFLRWRKSTDVIPAKRRSRAEPGPIGQSCRVARKARKSMRCARTRTGPRSTMERPMDQPPLRFAPIGLRDDEGCLVYPRLGRLRPQKIRTGRSARPARPSAA